jgi:hypothetical protein
VHFLAGDAKPAVSLPEPDCLLRVLEGHELRTVNALWAAFALSFQFPSYFGSNWDAFDECMTDLAWLPARGYRVVITAADACLADDVGHRPTLLRQMEGIGQRWSNAFALGDEWGGGHVPFNTVLLDAGEGWQQDG